MSMDDKIRGVKRHNIDSDVEVDTPSNKFLRLENQKTCLTPLETSYNDNIRPIIDAIRPLNLPQETIHLPTIVVIGDRSSGKSSLLESLTGISLPSYTRVPLIIKFENHLDLEPKFVLQYHHNQKFIEKFVEESETSKAISNATSEIAGYTNGISDIPLTLVVKKNGVPNMTLIDLPGSVKNSFGHQQIDLPEIIEAIIMTYVKPEENIILNVLSAHVSWSLWGSYRLSRLVDTTWKRTLAVVTTCDIDPAHAYWTVTEDFPNIGLDYICVRNKIEAESYEEARLEEAKLFETHPLLSKLNKTNVGIQRLANRITRLQGVIISKSLPKISDTINQRLDDSVSSLNKLPPTITNVAGATIAFMDVIRSLKKALRKTLIKGDGDEYMHEKQMHFNTRLTEMLEKFSKDLQSSVKFSDDFLNDEIKALNKTKMPKMFQNDAFPSLFTSKLKIIKDLSISFVKNVWDYIQVVIERIVNDRFENFPQLTPYVLTAVEHVMIRLKEKFLERVLERIEVEKATQYTLFPDYMSRREKLSGTYKEFLQAVGSHESRPKFVVEGYGEIDVDHLSSIQEYMLFQAFDVKMMFTAYWEVVIKQFGDWIAKFYLFQVKEVVIDEIDKEIDNELSLMGGGAKIMLKEAITIAEKRESIEKSIKLLQQSEQTIKQVMARRTENSCSSTALAGQEHANV